ncbi:BON domain-containing protein [Brachymonas sp.]|uniref:BON domain-containing protein n=1 Tax=Brachymonas sp. TaxID=1936292 RepID=UPI0035B23F1F
MPRFPASFPLRALCATLVLGSTLTACAPLLVGGAAGGAMLAVDRRTSGAQLDDEGIELRAKNRMASALQERGHLDPVSYNRILLLTGQVPTEADRQQAEAVARTVPNVRNVVNELTVGPAASLSQRTSDSLTTGRVKSALLGTRSLQSGAIKVVTELSTVYLMGIVTPREADLATSTVRDVNGVLKVVKVFEIVNESALNGGTIDSPAAARRTPDAAASAASAPPVAGAAVTTPVTSDSTTP